MKKLMLFTMVSVLAVGMMACSAQADEPASLENEIVAQEQTIEVYGKVSAGTSEHITFKQGFKVQEVNVKEGDIVSASDVLMIADLGSIENEIDYLNLQIQEKNKQLNATNTNYQQAANSLTDAKEAAKLSEQTYLRQKTLFDASAISKLELDSAYEAWQAALRSVSGAQVGVKSSLNSDSTSTGSLQLELSRAEQSLEELKAFLASENLDGTNVISALDKAIVASVNTQSGLFASSYQSLIELYDTSSLVVKAKVSEEFIQSVKIGQSVRIIPLMDREQVLTGKVSFISAKATYENGETSVPIEITFDEATTLMPNLNVDIEIPIQ